MNAKFIFLVSFFLITNVHASHNRYNILEVVDEAGKETLITKEIQSLIDSASRDGGGYVYFPPGDYLTGTIVLRDNVYLELGPGATLWGSTNINDYPKIDGEPGPLIYSNGADNIGIVGKGTINGNGDFFWKGKKRPYNRPQRFILLTHGKNIRVEDVTILNSPNWNLDVRFSDGVWIDGIKMISDLESPNSDGIDPVSSKNVFISNCYIEVGDDAICPKSRGGVPTENLVVTNCVLISDDTAIKLGTRSDGHIRNATFSNIVIRDSVYGLALYAKDGGTYENIRFDNIHIETPEKVPGNRNVDKETGTYPIFVDLEKRSPDSKLGKVQNIFFNDISINSPDGVNLFLGQPDMPLKNIHLSNVQVTIHESRSFEGRKKPRGTRSLKDKAPNDFAHIPAHFIFAYADGLFIDQLHVVDKYTGKDFQRRMFWGYALDNVTISDFSNQLAEPDRSVPQFHLKNSSNIEMKLNTPAYTSAPFLLIEGDKSKEVILHNNNFRRLGKVVETGNGFDKPELIYVNNLE